MSGVSLSAGGSAGPAAAPMMMMAAGPAGGGGAASVPDKPVTALEFMRVLVCCRSDTVFVGVQVFVGVL